MSVDYYGDSVVIFQDATYSQRDGTLLSYREKGTPAEIVARANAWKSSGWDVTMNSGGPYWSLHAVRNVGSQEALPLVTQWSVTTEILAKPIWSLPAVMDEADAFVGPPPPATPAPGPCSYKKGIEKAHQDGTDLPAAYSGLGTAENVLLELRRGATEYEHDYTVLQRTRSFDFLAPPSNITFDTTRLIYTTAQLQAAEGIPAEVMFTLPADTAAQAQTMWGWRLRSQEADIQSRTTGTHTASWIYAQWSTFLYTPAT